MAKRKTVIGIVVACIVVLFLTVGVYFYKTSYQPEPEGEEIVVTEEPPKPQVTKKKPKKENPEDLPEVPAGEDIVPEPESEELTVEIIEEEAIEEESAAEPRELTTVHIRHSRSLFSNPNSSSDPLQVGKIYYDGDNGKLESFVNKKEDIISEKLISFDYRGNRVDSLEISLVEDGNEFHKYAVISHNKISIFQVMPTKNKKGKEELVTEYIITPNMKFVKGKTYTKLL